MLYKLCNSQADTQRLLPHDLVHDAQPQVLYSVLGWTILL
jgi:hypothetical protein